MIGSCSLKMKVLCVCMYVVGVGCKYQSLGLEDLYWMFSPVGYIVVGYCILHRQKRLLLEFSLECRVTYFESGEGVVASWLYCWWGQDILMECVLFGEKGLLNIVSWWL
mmetsp:Transcript_21189/g.46102  ORF Transcript_21189/g.46102 Transcript_21189/m.46102 type:complete len:109 (-) Transcript_21189:19-345(-)